MSQKISYAQNSEDIILARVFSDVENGNYLDVGANHPITDSVTKYFYDNGWSGINIEPLKREFKMLLEDRPRDINLNICVGEANTTIEFVVVENRSGWSTADPTQIEKIQRDLELKKTVVLVEQQTLNEILSNNYLSELHFLKIDVEGSELNVLQGIDLNKNRPWVVVIESTEPGSQISSHQSWEYLLTDNQYTYAYSDGINRFYLANEKLILLPRFSHPPNAFDGFITWVAVEYYQKMMHEKDLVNRLEDELTKVFSSTSWKATVPLRKFSALIKKFRKY
jgi:FkbM family methyltransferase